MYFSEKLKFKRFSFATVYFTILMLGCILYGSLVSYSLDLIAVECRIERGSLPDNSIQKECYDRFLVGKGSAWAAFDRVISHPKGMILLLTSITYLSSFALFLSTVIRFQGQRAYYRVGRWRRVIIWARTFAPFVIGAIVLSYAYPKDFVSIIFRFSSIFTPSMFYVFLNIVHLMRHNTDEHRPASKLKNYADRTLSFLVRKLCKNRKLNSFENRIFFPSYLLFSSAIMTGITAVNVGNDQLRDLVSFNVFLTVFPIIQIASLLTYYYTNARRDYLLIYTPLLIIIASLVLSVKMEFNEAKYIISLYCVTYSLIITDSVIYFHYNNKGSFSSRDRSQKIYLPALNWAFSIFSVVCMFPPIVFFNMSYAPLLTYNIFTLSFWLFSSRATKFRRFSLLFGVSASVLCILMHVSSLSSEPHSGYSAWMLERLTSNDNAAAIWLAVVLTLISTLGASITIIRFTKDVLGLKLEAFFYNLLKKGMFDEFLGAYMLLMVSSMVFCIICTILSFVTINFSESQDFLTYITLLRISFSALTTVVVTVFSMVVLWLVPGRLTGAIREAYSINKRAYGEPIEPPSH